MKKLILLLVLGLVATGCKKGEKGDQGDTGIQGLRGPGSIEILTGNVTSDGFFVTDSRISNASQVSVYISVSSEYIQLPIYNIGGSFNVLYTVNPTLGRVSIFNALSGSGATYVIVLII